MRDSGRNPLKPAAQTADISWAMTIPSPRSLDEWAARPAPKIARLLIAAGGTLVAMMVLTRAVAVSQAAWVLVIFAASLAATSTKAAKAPTRLRLGVLAAYLTVIFLYAALI